jgi:LRR receptor-like serine/threonine-protein kinase FLS2
MLPSQLENSGSLSRIHLDQTQISGPLSNFSAWRATLKEVNFSGTALVGSVPFAWGNLSYLETIDLSKNLGLSGEIPSMLQSLPNLKFLDVSETKLSGTLPDLINNLPVSIGK